MKWLGLVVACWLLSLASSAFAGEYPDQMTAYTTCQSDLALALSAKDEQGRSYTAYRSCTPNGNYSVTCQVKKPGEQVYVACGYWRGGTQFDTTYNWPKTAGCAQRPATTSGWSSAGNGSSCLDGCAFGPASSSETQSFGGRVYFSLAGATPTGNTCGSDDGSGQKVAKDDCVQTGTLTQCMRPDGKVCATASTGKQFCWSPGEQGQKMADNGNQAALKSPDNAQINAPRTPPANGGDWQVTGQGTMSQTSGGITTTSNITTFDSTYGKDGTGKGDGTGTGSDGGSGGGTGDGDGEGDDDGPGSVGEAAGDFYDGTDLTITGLLTDYYGKVTATPMLASIKSFMMVSGGGSCPVFTMPATAWTPALTFDAHCSGSVYAVLLTMGWVLLGVVSYYAVRIAVT